MAGAPTLAVAIGAGAVVGFGAGTVDVAANTLAPGLVAPDALVSSMNTLHMCFAIGALATPLVVGLSMWTTDGLGLAAACFVIPLALLGGVLLRRDRASRVLRADPTAIHADDGVRLAAWRLAIVGAFFFCNVGLESGWAGWIATYAHEIDLGNGWGIAFTAGFWGGFLAGRIAMARHGDALHAGRTLWTTMIAALALALAVAAAGSRPVPVLVASVLFGAAIAPQFPTMLVHLHRAVPLTGRATAWCIGGAAVGGMVIPPLIGALLDRVGAPALPWSVAGTAFVSLGVLALVDGLALRTEPAAVP